MECQKPEHRPYGSLTAQSNNASAAFNHQSTIAVRYNTMSELSICSVLEEDGVRQSVAMCLCPADMGNLAVACSRTFGLCKRVYGPCKVKDCQKIAVYDATVWRLLPMCFGTCCKPVGGKSMLLCEKHCGELTRCPKCMKTFCSDGGSLQRCRTAGCKTIYCISCINECPVPGPNHCAKYFCDNHAGLCSDPDHHYSKFCMGCRQLCLQCMTPKCLRCMQNCALCPSYSCLLPGCPDAARESQKTDCYSCSSAVCEHKGLDGWGSFRLPIRGYLCDHCSSERTCERCQNRDCGLKRCNACKAMICAKHFSKATQSYIATAKSRSGDFRRFNHPPPCSVCCRGGLEYPWGGYLCNDHLSSCSGCRGQTCDLHAQNCFICRVKFCEACGHTCTVCGKLCCFTCMATHKPTLGTALPTVGMLYPSALCSSHETPSVNGFHCSKHAISIITCPSCFRGYDGTRSSRDPVTLTTCSICKRVSCKENCGSGECHLCKMTFCVGCLPFSCCQFGGHSKQLCYACAIQCDYCQRKFCNAHTIHGRPCKGGCSPSRYVCARCAEDRFHPTYDLQEHRYFCPWCKQREREKEDHYLNDVAARQVTPDARYWRCLPAQIRRDVSI